MNGDEITRRDLVQNDMPEHVFEPEMSPESGSLIRRHTMKPAFVKMLGVKQPRHTRLDVSADCLVHPEQHWYLAALPNRMQAVPMSPHPGIDLRLLLINSPEPRGSTHFQGVDFRNPVTLRALPLIKFAQREVLERYIRSVPVHRPK